MTQAIFLHIPKTAGTSILKSLHDRLGPEHMYWLGHGNDPKVFLRNSDRSAFAHYKIVAGHLTYHLARTIPGPKVYFSTVREPVARAVSLYNFIAQTNATHPLHEEISACRLEQALDHSARFRGEIADRQCIILGGTKCFDDAIRTILAEPFVLADHNNAQHIVDAMTAMVGIERFALPNLNAGPPGYHRELASPEALARIHELTTQDRLLFDLLAG